MPVEFIKGYDIEIEPVISNADIIMIMKGKNRRLKAMIFNYLFGGTSRVKRGLEEAMRDSAVNTLGEAAPEGNPKKHRGGGRSVNKGKGLESFFRLTSASRDRRRR